MQIFTHEFKDRVSTVSAHIVVAAIIGGIGLLLIGLVGGIEQGLIY